MKTKQERRIEFALAVLKVQTIAAKNIKECDAILNGEIEPTDDVMKRHRDSARKCWEMMLPFSASEDESIRVLANKLLAVIQEGV
jgi:hypothetical protein